MKKRRKTKNKKIDSSAAVCWKLYVSPMHTHNHPLRVMRQHSWTARRLICRVFGWLGLLGKPEQRAEPSYKFKFHFFSPLLRLFSSLASPLTRAAHICEHPSQPPSRCCVGLFGKLIKLINLRFTVRPAVESFVCFHVQHHAALGTLKASLMPNLYGGNPGDLQRNINRYER